MKSTIEKELDEDVLIDTGDVQLEGSLKVPEGAIGLVVFAHGSGSSRFSPRNNRVADALRERGMGTLLFDLLTEEEDRVYENRFNIDLLTDRLVDTIEWLQNRSDTGLREIGLFGSSTGAASALNAAARLKFEINSVVSRGGRPDLSLPALPDVEASVLLIVGQLDTPVIGMNEKAFDALRSEKELKIVQGATHLFEEPGTLDEIINLSGEWFENHFKRK